VILRRICQLSLTRITHQVSRAFDLNNSRHNDVSEVFTGIDGTVELFITKFAVKSPEWYFAVFYTFMNIVLTADHFEILIRKALLFQCSICEILTFQFLKWSCDEIVI
jgi:hypothetical protein